MNDSGALTLIKAARLLDGAGGRPIENGAVLVEGGAIRAVGRQPTSWRLRALRSRSSTSAPRP